MSQPRPIKLLQLTPDLAVQPSLVAAVRRSALDEDACTVYMAGQSAVDGGFVIEREFDEVVDELSAAIDEAAED